MTTSKEQEAHAVAPDLDSGEEEMEPKTNADGEPASSRRSTGATVVIMIALCMAVFLAALDAVIITVALPTISRELGASDSGYAWIGSAYLLANATSIPFWGKVSDIFGRKPMLIIANAVFMAGSLIAALATNLQMLIGGRVIQGLGGGGLITLVNICIGDLFSPK
jgi:MFS family permease